MNKISTMISTLRYFLKISSKLFANILHQKVGGRNKNSIMPLNSCNKWENKCDREISFSVGLRAIKIVVA